jgi:DNA topoisomerase I
VQIGTKDDEEKPRFAGLRPGQKMDSISLEEALELFKLPRELGETPEGEPVSVNIGRFGPYVKFGNRYASLKPDDDPFTIELSRALELVAEKKEADANKYIRVFEEAGVQVLNGRYGPYITDGSKNARIPKDRDPKSLTLEECQALLAAAPERKGRRGAAKKKAAPAKKAATRKSAPKKKTTTRKKAAPGRRSPRRSRLPARRRGQVRPPPASPGPASPAEERRAPCPTPAE